MRYKFSYVLMRWFDNIILLLEPSKNYDGGILSITNDRNEMKSDPDVDMIENKRWRRRIWRALMFWVDMLFCGWVACPLGEVIDSGKRVIDDPGRRVFVPPRLSKKICTSRVFIHALCPYCSHCSLIIHCGLSANAPGWSYAFVRINNQFISLI